MDAGGRVTHGAVTERQSEGAFGVCARLFTLTPTLSLRERESDHRLS
jgi:hypothetical protein